MSVADITPTLKGMRSAPAHASDRGRRAEGLTPLSACRLGHPFRLKSSAIAGPDASQRRSARNSRARSNDPDGQAAIEGR